MADAAAADAAVTSGRDVTLRAARESITLLRNQNNVLPLSPTAHVVVTGPSADSMTNQLGGWSVSWQGVFGAGHVCCMGPPDQIPPGTTVLQGLKSEDPSVVSAPDQATAVHDAASADAVVVAVGEKAYAEGLGDNPAPQLTSDQTSLVSALEATGKPVIVVVIAGRPLGLGPAGSGQSQTVHVSFPVSELAVTPGDIEGAGVPQVQLGGYQVQVGSMSAGFTIHR